MPILRAIVRYGYAPFMMLGLTTVAYLIVSELVVERGQTWAYVLLIPLLAVAYLTAFGAEKIAPFFEDWNDHHEHGDSKTTFFHVVVYEYQATVGVLLIPVICWNTKNPHTTIRARFTPGVSRFFLSSWRLASSSLSAVCCTCRSETSIPSLASACWVSP